MDSLRLDLSRLSLHPFTRMSRPDSSPPVVRHSVLENRFPPPIVTVVVTMIMAATQHLTPVLMMPLRIRLAVSLPISLAGVLVVAVGVRTFQLAQTTLDPVHIQRAASLVTNGIYRYSRNPMYVGLLLIQIGWAVYLAAPIPFLFPMLFVLFTTRYQIIPEERNLVARFGQDYADYRIRVRRWL